MDNKDLGRLPSAPGSSPSGQAPTGLAGSAATIPSAGFDWWRLLPGYWIQNEPTDRVWDVILNEALDLFGVTAMARHYCHVGPYEVWTSNWPYAFGKCSGYSTGLPTVATRRRLRAMLMLARMAAHRKLASAMSARSAETEGLSPQDASAVGDSRDAQEPSA